MEIEDLFQSCRFGWYLSPNHHDGNDEIADDNDDENNGNDGDDENDDDDIDDIVDDGDGGDVDYLGTVSSYAPPRSDGLLGWSVALHSTVVC